MGGYIDWYMTELTDGRFLGIQAYSKVSRRCECCAERHVYDFEVLKMRIYKSDKDLKGKPITLEQLGDDWEPIRKYVMSILRDDEPVQEFEKTHSHQTPSRRPPDTLH
jgi:hypothetical protein